MGGSEGAAGATANDPRDPDTGPDALQNKPKTTAARISGGKTMVEGTLNSTPNSILLVQIFANPSGNDGRTFLGQTGVTTDANGNATFVLNPSVAVPAGQTVTATATAGGDTSEFSGPRAVATS